MVKSIDSISLRAALLEGNEIAIIDQGKFIARGTASQLKSQINKPESTLEEVFIELTGKDLQEE